MKDIFELMKKLESEKWSGEIQITASEGNALILIQEGHFLYAHRPIDRSAERLEKLGWAEVPPQNILIKIRSWEEFVKKILHVNSDNYEALIRYLKTDRFEVFFRIFFWSNLELIPRAFQVDLSDQPELAFYRPKQLSSLLKEAKTRLKEWPLIQDRIGSSRRYFLSQVPSSDSAMRRINPDAIDLALSEFAEHTGMGVIDQSSFTDEELEIVRLCDGRHSVQDIIRLSPDGEFLTLRRLIDLWDKGFVLPKDDLATGGRRRSGAKAIKTTWKDVLAISLCSLIFLIYLLGSKYLRPSLADQDPPSAQILQGLNVYRAKTGRYPVTLGELNELQSLHLERPERYSYQLNNLSDFSLKKAP